MDSPPPCKKTRLETGTCNVCAAPCSSCMHFSLTETGMDSKIEEECSNTVCVSQPANRLKKRNCSDRQRTASETSNLMSATSSHNSYSENAESKLLVRSQNEVEHADAPGEVGKEEESGGSDFHDKGRASNTGKSSVPQQDDCESEQSGSDVIEDDVKVCDICGDAGREDLLAVCSRCSDGAEHTYCMRTRLDKVPEGMWLCEGCEIEVDMEKEKSEKNEGLTTTSLQLSEENVKVNAHDFQAKNLPKSDVKVAMEEKSSCDKAVTSPHKPVKRQSDNIEVSSTMRRETNDTGLRDSGKRPSLSREYSSKNLDASKLKHAKSTFMNDTGPSHSVTTSITTSSRVNQLHLPRRPLARSNTFSSSSLKSKVKHLQDQMFHKQKLTKGIGSHDGKKEGLSHKMDRSVSFRSTSSRYADASDSKLKEQSPPRDSKCPKFSKDKDPLERRSSFKSDNHSVISLPPVLNSTSAMKPIQPSMVSNKGYAVISSDSSGGVNKQSSSAGAGILADQKQQLASSKDEMKSKDLNLASRTQQPVLTKPRSSRCAKCDSTGHTTDLCSVSSFRCASVKDPSSAVSREGTSKNSKWKDMIEAALSKITAPNNTGHIGRCNNGISPADHSSSSNKLSDRQEELPISKAVLGSKTIIDKDQLFSLNGKNVPLQQVENMAISDGVKPCITKVSTYDSLLNHSLRISVIPEHDFLWQGCFEVLTDGGRHLEIVNGLQAHLSTFASPRVPEMVKKFFDNIELEEVSRLSSWPVQFKEKGASEDNIAIYIFAKDFESYNRHYKKLVENMEKNELALKGNIDGVELLIYCSNQLPVKAHLWNGFLYLWAVFRERNADTQLPSTVPPNNFGDMMTVEPPKGLSNQLSSKGIAVQKLASVFRERNADTQLPSTGPPNNFGDMMTEEPPKGLSNQLSSKGIAVQKLASVFRERNADTQLPSTGPPNNFGDMMTVEPPKGLSNQLSSKGIAVQKLASVDLNEELPASCNLPEPPKVFDAGVPLDIQSVSSSGVQAEASGKESSSNKQYEGCSLNQPAIISPPLSKHCSSMGFPVDCTTSSGTEVGRTITSMKDVYEDCKSETAKVVQSSTSMIMTQCPIDKGKVFPIQLDDEKAGCPSSSVDKQQNFSSLFKTAMVHSVPDSKEIAGEGGMAGKNGEEQEKGRSMIGRNFICLPALKDKSTKDENGLEAGNSGKKNGHSISFKRNFEACVEKAGESEGVLWNENTNSALVEGQQQKKIKYCKEPFSWTNSFERKPPPTKMVSPYCSSSKVDLNEAYNCEDDVVHDIEKNAPFFQVDIGPTKCFSQPTELHVISDDDDEPLEPVLHLGLALGSEKRSPKEELTLFFDHEGDESNNIDNSSPNREGGDDVTSASLSLSLAFPDSKKEQFSKSDKKTHQVMSERERVSTSLVLFGGFPDN